MSGSENQIFQTGENAPPAYFTGAAFVKMLATDTVFNCTIANVIFEPGARNNWHTHPGGQVLLVTDGTGYFQEKGQPIRLLHKGDVVQIQPHVKHWHGASPDSALTHIAINPNAQLGTVEWLEKVTDEEYESFK